MLSELNNISIALIKLKTEPEVFLYDAESYTKGQAYPILIYELKTGSCYFKGYLESSNGLISLSYSLVCLILHWEYLSMFPVEGSYHWFFSYLLVCHTYWKHHLLYLSCYDTKATTMLIYLINKVMRLELRASVVVL